MSFLDYEPDLTGTIFTQEDLKQARHFLLTVIKNHDPKWLLKPTGLLKFHWLGHGDQASCRLIALARVLWILDHNITARSKPLLLHKFKSLLRPASDKAYDDLLTELQVGHL